MRSDCSWSKVSLSGISADGGALGTLSVSRSPIDSSSLAFQMDLR